jgi:RNA polymerase subunit RPABC4/transcription elongation factor Spt4
MRLKPCRDCGELVPSDARGCPRCARNLEAERMLAKYFWTGLALVILAIVFATYLIHSNR